MYPNREMPQFRWLRVTATRPSDADFRLTQDYRLEVSDAALALLRQGVLDHAVVEKS